MKRRSRIFLIVSAAIFGAGVILCLIGMLVAGGKGEQLFAEKTQGGRGYVYEFKDSSIDILKFNVSDADINIIGGADSSRIEIINFNESLYTFENSSSMVSFRQSPDLSSVASFWESGFSFKGLRYFLHPASGKEAKVINVYLSDDQYIKVFDLTCSEGTIFISKVSTKSDYQLHPGKNKLIIKNVSTDETVNITSSDSVTPEIVIENTEAGTLNITASKAKISTSFVYALSCNIELSGGCAELDYAALPEGCELTVNVSTKGKLTVNGEAYTDSYKYPDPEKDQPSGGSDKNDDTEKTDISNVSISVNTALSNSDASIALTVPMENDTNAPVD